jgi:hypothetical protein
VLIAASKFQMIVLKKGNDGQIPIMAALAARQIVIL